MKKLIFTLILSLFLIFLTLEANAQGNINIKLKMPPPGKLFLENFWEVALTNNTNSEQSVYLVGTATEEIDGLIARGTTASFKIKKGTTILKIKDLPKTPDIEYLAKDRRYKDALIKKGEFPSGVYEICVSVKNSKTNEEEGIDCFTHVVGEEGILSLINPSDGQEIDSKTPVIFTWSYSGKMPDDGYTLKIVELKSGQTPEGTMERNRAYFEKDRIKSTTFSYPSSAPKFEDGKKYAWEIKTTNLESEAWTFVIGKDSNITNKTKLRLYMRETERDPCNTGNNYCGLGPVWATDGIKVKAYIKNNNLVLEYEETPATNDGVFIVLYDNPIHPDISKLLGYERMVLKNGNYKIDFSNSKYGEVVIPVYEMPDMYKNAKTSWYRWVTSIAFRKYICNAMLNNYFIQFIFPSEYNRVHIHFV